MASIFSATGISLSLFVSLVSLCVTHGISLSSRNPSLSKPLNHAPQTIVACCVLHNICQIAGEPEPKLFKDPKETVVLPLPIVRPLESEKSFYCFGESLRQAMADDLQERHQRLLQRLHGVCKETSLAPLIRRLRLLPLY